MKMIFREPTQYGIMDTFMMARILKWEHETGEIIPVDGQIGLSEVPKAFFEWDIGYEYPTIECEICGGIFHGDYLDGTVCPLCRESVRVIREIFSGPVTKKDFVEGV